MRKATNHKPNHETMKQHIVKLTFIYDEETFPEVDDKESAINQAIKELEEIPIQDFEFDYEES
jgi:hypothetical protein